MMLVVFSRIKSRRRFHRGDLRSTLLSPVHFSFNSALKNENAK